MTGGSIRFRLWSAAAISILVALAIAGVGLVFLFERHAERQLETDLIVDLNQVVGAVHSLRRADRGLPRRDRPAVQRAAVGLLLAGDELRSGAAVRSRSLWDGVIAAAAPRRRPSALLRDGGAGRHAAAGARSHGDRRRGRSFRVAVAQDHGVITQSVGTTLPSWCRRWRCWAGLCAAIFVQITVGLAPLGTLRDAVRDIVAGRSARLDVAAPPKCSR